METQEQKQKRIKRQTIWRSFNTLIASAALFLTISATVVVPDMVEEKGHEAEIAQLLQDESIRYKVYKDSLGKATIGVGHLMKPTDTFTELTPHEALELFRKDYNIARESVERNYPWATGSVKRVLINMTFQMGTKGVSNFKGTLAAMEAGNYQLAAAEMLDSAWSKRQTRNRSVRLAGRILELESTWW